MNLQRILLFLSAILIGCSENSKPKEYSVIREDFEPVFEKNMIDVSLKRSMSESELRDIASELIPDEKLSMRYNFRFYVAGLKMKAAWAVAEHNNGLTVQINGQTDEQRIAMLKAINDYSSANPGQTRLGLWRSDEQFFGKTIAIFKQSDKLFIHEVYPDLSGGVDPLTIKTINGQQCYGRRDKENNSSTYYVIDPSQNLLIFNNEGKPFGDAHKLEL